MADLHETQIDGVRCFWVETARPTLAAMLVFRFGQADEPIVESGWQHLLEHLALNDRGRGAVQVNGQTTLLETIFQIHGPPDDVAVVLEGVTAWLSEPDLSRLDNEAKVLRAEATVRGVAPAASALTMRYGAQGPGLAGYLEPGLGRATPSALTARAARVFTQGNAILVLDGPPPTGLRLRLPPGGLLPTSPAVPCDDVLPAAYLSETGLTVSGVVARSSGMYLTHDLLRSAMSERFREKDGIAYAPWVIYERVDDEHAVVVGGSDIQQEGVGSVADKTLLLVDKLRKNLAEPVAYERLRAGLIQSLLDPYARVGVAVRAAHEAFRGRPPLTLEQMVDEVNTIDLVAVQESWEAFHASMLLGVPPGSAWTGQLPVLEFPVSSPTRAGKRFRSTNWPADRARLTISDTGLEISVQDEARRIAFDQIAAVLSFEDGYRRVIRDDGYALSIDPRVWRSGHSAVARLDAAVPAELRLTHPPIPGLREVKPWGLLKRWGNPVAGFASTPFRMLDRYLVGAGLVIVAALALVIVMLAQHTGGYVIVIVATVFVVRMLVAASGRHIRSRSGRGR